MDTITKETIIDLGKIVGSELEAYRYAMTLALIKLEDDVTEGKIELKANRNKDSEEHWIDEVLRRRKALTAVRALRDRLYYFS